ncbi:MAG: type II secretion system protein GspL [Halieaceae bacterium]|jgi:type II secretion system protein L|nr:type II secretion system protein GspL [Halieaceae bacterium]
MSENLSVLVLCANGLRWLRPGRDALELDGDAVRAELRAELSRRGHNVVFAAPGSDLRLLEVSVAPEERRHLETSLPYRLEEAFTEDIDTLHFARHLRDREHCEVAVVAQERMRAWSELLGEFALLLPWCPEPLLLPWSEGEWTVVMESDTAVLRWGSCAGTRIERSLLPMLFDGLAVSAVAERVVIYGSDEAADRSLLPAAQRERCEWRRGDLGTALWLAGELPALDLRQGPYAPQLPYQRWWAQWRAVAGLAGLALLLHVVSGWLDLQRLERHNEALRREIQSVYRSVNPRGAVVDAERQLQRQLAGLKGGGGGGGSFASLLAPIAAGFTAQPGMQLASMTFSQARNELRLNLLAPDFDAVENLRSGLVAAGLSATLESSARSGDRVRARLRVGDPV